VRRWNVTYTEYGNKEAIDIRHMRLPPSSAAPAPAPERPASPTAATAPAAKPDKGGAPKRKVAAPRAPRPWRREGARVRLVREEGRGVSG